MSKIKTKSAMENEDMDRLVNLLVAIKMSDNEQFVKLSLKVKHFVEDYSLKREVINDFNTRNY